jgi:hypothetical protein
VLQGFERATRLGQAQADQGPSDAPPKDELSGIVIDMSLRAADTLLETLHVRQSTSGIPLVAVKCDGKTIPLALRRLCKDIVETHSALPLDGPELGES